jgi:hypothetical protein
MSQLWGMLKNPALFVNSKIDGQIPLVPSSASRVRCVSDWYTAPLVVKEGSPRGEGTIGLTKSQCRINPEKRPLSVSNILNMLHNLSFFFSSYCRLFHNATLFGSCIIHILNAGCARYGSVRLHNRLFIDINNIYLNRILT